MKKKRPSKILYPEKIYFKSEIKTNVNKIWNQWIGAGKSAKGSFSGRRKMMPDGKVYTNGNESIKK